MNKLSMCPRRRGVPALVGRAVTAAALILCTADAARAQLFSALDNPYLNAVPVRGTDTAYDPVNKVFLVVGSTSGNSITPLFGVFTNTAGAPITAPFQINVPGEHAHFPRVVYSPHVGNGAGGAGGFLVAWHGGLFTNTIRTRIVAYPGLIVSAETQTPSPPGSTFQEAGAAVAYSPSSFVFLVTWQASNFTVWGATIATNGQRLVGPFQISPAGVGARDPSVAWNALTNEFGVLYSGFSPSGATTTFARVTPGGAVVRTNTFNVTSVTYITDLVYNGATGRYLAAWFQGGTYGAEIDGAGDVVGVGLLSTTTGTRDGLGLAYNPASGTFLLAGMGPSYNLWAAELNRRGARTSADYEITSAGGPLGSYHPRATARTDAHAWNVSFYHNSGLMRNQVVSTSSSGGGPGGNLPAPGGTAPPPTQPPPPPPPTGGCTTPDPFAALGGGTCVNGGWLPPSGGGGSGCATASPGVGWTCVNGGWLPPTSGGTSSGGCATASPGIGWTCVNGGWLPPGSGGTSSGGCTTGSPGSGWTCVNGGWLPPGSGGTSSGGCTTGSPGSGWTCVNGGWLPPGSGGTTSGGCTTGSPGSGWTCVNGGWLPPGSGGSSSGGCLTGSPGSGWTCVNGGWLPPGSGSSTSGGCTTGSPGSGWICVNGGWLPPGSGGGGGSTCSTPDPFTAFGGGTCVNGGWTFGTTRSGGCTTPDPFTAMGGGICSNGGWVPRSED